MTAERWIVVDVASGADRGQAALAAAAAASAELQVQIAVVGERARIDQELAHFAYDAERLRVVPVDASAGPASDDVDAFAPSVETALREVAARPDAALVTAAHPRAVVRGATKHLAKLPGIRRPALAAVVPTLRHRGALRDPFALLLDVGATQRCTTDDLVQFARMGAVYARAISKNERPIVGVLSTTSTLSAAPRAHREAVQRLQSLRDAPFDVAGLVRADQVLAGEADVIVADGATGNVLVRTLEGVAASGEALLARAKERFTWRIGASFLGSGLDRLRAIADWENYGGAPLLGMSRTVVVTDRRAGERALFNAIRLAAKIERLNVPDDIEKAFGD